MRLEVDMRHIVSTALIAMAVGVSPALAHHSWAGFDITPVTFDARIEAVKIENPHTLIELRGTDGQRYTIVWMAINGLVRMGHTPDFLRELLKPGDMLVVTGRLKREPEGVQVLPVKLDHRTHGQIFPARQP